MKMNEINNISNLTTKLEEYHEKLEKSNDQINETYDFVA